MSGGQIERPRGTHDVTPAEMPLWQRVTGEIDRLCALYGYRRVLTPVFEDTALFARTSGQGSDVVQKEMYTFEDRGGRSLTLRPEGTAPICRAYVEHGMHREPQPQKLYTIATMYRYAAPQKGRYREHWQASVEAIGSDDPALDAELIQLYDTLLGRLGVVDYTLQLNSIGTRASRQLYLVHLRQWLNAHWDRLDDETRQKAQANPLRVFDNLEAKPPAVRVALEEAPKIVEALDDEDKEHFAAVRADLDAYGVRYELVPTLVRGLDYYTRTTWEFAGPALGAQSTISGGGRYDGLVEEIGGPPTPGVGFGAGIERLVEAMKGAGEGAERPGTDVFFLVEPGVDESRRRWALREMSELRRLEVACDTDYARRSRKGQVTQAGRLGAKLVVEVTADQVAIQGRRIPESDVRDAVVSRLER